MTTIPMTTPTDPQAKLTVVRSAEPINATQAYCDFAEQIAAQRTARELKYADVPPPGGAIRVDEHWRYNEGQARRFQGTKRGTDVRVDIIGWQDCDGSIVRNVVLDSDIFIDSTASARELAADLLAAADEMDARAD